MLNTCVKELNNRKKQLEKIIEMVTKELPRLPKGNLRIQKKRETAQYYQVTEKGDTHGSFIRVENRKLAEELAQKTYYEKLLREAQREILAIDTFMQRMEGKSPEDVYASMNTYRKALVTPMLISNEEYAKKWEEEPYERNPFRPEECIHPTDRGDLVRSKSEARIADMYYALGIPYRYEALLRLKNGKTKYPDFTLLKMPERTLYYHEHMGLMEDEFYRRNNLVKIKEYAESGICTGKNLILTFETDYTTLDIRTLRNNVKNIFLF